MRALVRALFTQKNDAQKGCAMQLNGITLSLPLAFFRCDQHQGFSTDVSYSRENSRPWSLLESQFLVY